MEEFPMQQSCSYTEQSTLLSTSSPSRWRRYSLNRRIHTTLRQDIWTVLRFRSSLQHSYGLQLASYMLELSVLILILLNVVVAVSESTVMLDAPTTSSSSPPQGNDWMNIFLLVSTIIFSIEYMLRLWSCVEDDRFGKGPIYGRLKWMTRPLSLIDLLSLIPFYLELGLKLDTHNHGGLTLRSLRLLRVVSFLRLERMYNAMKNLQVIFARKKEEFLVVSYLTAVVVLTSSLLIFFIEHVAQPSTFSSFSVCVWWSVETITSLGYGDIVPVTGLGRVVAASLAFWGIILFTIPGAVLGSGFIEVMLEKQRKEEAEMYRLAAGDGKFNNNNKLPFVDTCSDDENTASGHVHMPLSVASTNSPSRLQTATAARNENMYQKIETIMAGQRRLETRFQQQQQQLERLIQLFEAAHVVDSAPSGVSTKPVQHIYDQAKIQSY